MGFLVSNDATINGNVTVTSSNPAISVDGKLTIDGDVTATATNNNPAIECGTVTIVSGTWIVECTGGGTIPAISVTDEINIPETHEVCEPFGGTVGLCNIENPDGSPASRVVIAPAAVILAEDEDNSTVLDKWNGLETSVRLQRTLLTGGWNTFAAPFDITDLEGTFGDDVKVKQLTASSLSNGELTLSFEEADEITAGAPYLIKVDDEVDLSSFRFWNVGVTDETVPTETDAVDFVPFAPT